MNIKYNLIFSLLISYPLFGMDALLERIETLSKNLDQLKRQHESSRINQEKMSKNLLEISWQLQKESNAWFEELLQKLKVLANEENNQSNVQNQSSAQNKVVNNVRDTVKKPWRTSWEGWLEDIW